MSLIPIISQAQKDYTELTPKEVKSERNTKIKIVAAAAFVLIGFGVSLYLMQHASTRGGGSFAMAGTLLFSAFVVPAGLFLSLFALTRNDAESQKFPGEEYPDLSNDKIKQARITLLTEGSLEAVYRQLYMNELGVRPYVQAGMLTVEQGDELSSRLQAYKVQSGLVLAAQMAYYNRTSSSSISREQLATGLLADSEYQDAKSKLDELQMGWSEYRQTLFPQGEWPSNWEAGAGDSDPTFAFLRMPI